LEFSDLDFLFIENVGNLVCPASYDLGEDMQVVLFSVTEGEDKPFKYLTIINTADLAIIAKMDLAQAVGFAIGAQQHSSGRPGMQNLEVSAKNNYGMDRWLELLAQLREEACV
jgi:hydrogenase nickel incorporation protein HypB